MVSGTFSRFGHDHFYVTRGEQTKIEDVFDCTSPLVHALSGDMDEALAAALSAPNE